MTSKQVGRCQGIYALEGQQVLALLMAMNVVFTDGRYNGSTLSIMGRNPVLGKVREIPVISGTGAFRMARGYAIIRTLWVDSKTRDATVQYDVVVVHRCVPIPMYGYIAILVVHCFPVDDSRVVLDSSNDNKLMGNGYINASFIRPASGGNLSCFIATQGPLPETVEDFWEMVVKCGDYFHPEEGSRQFGKICVTTKHMKICVTSLVLRYMEVNNQESNAAPLPVLYLQYPHWPNHGEPVDTRAVRYHLPGELGPLVVHCRKDRAFCTILHTIQLTGYMSAVDLDKTIIGFRSQRIGMVQTKVKAYVNYSFLSVFSELFVRGAYLSFILVYILSDKL
ncbi:protein-tyrosine-phosphatase PTP1-like [Nymphaea colorata]|nr:protein-tyrosine-phosphatase PTP1-like [Nymphaea colorata]